MEQGPSSFPLVVLLLLINLITSFPLSHLPQFGCVSSVNAFFFFFFRLTAVAEFSLFCLLDGSWSYSCSLLVARERLFYSFYFFSD